jgi:sugar/nucleoside kinase (ribokinase family)
MTIVPSARTTTFENEYSPAGRRQKLTAYAEKLSPKALPQVWRQADIVHLGPIAQEVDPELTRSFPASFIGITPQGWLRAWDKHGHVRLETWETLKGSVAQASVVILSIEDLGGDEGAVEDLAKLCSILVVTRAAEGATVYWNDQAHDLPAPEQKEVESTGAGDIFAAAFFVRLRETKNPLEAGRFANFLASASVTRRGLASTPTQEEIAAAKSKVVP